MLIVVVLILDLLWLLLVASAAVEVFRSNWRIHVVMRRVVTAMVLPTIGGAVQGDLLLFVICLASTAFVSVVWGVIARIERRTRDLNRKTEELEREVDSHAEWVIGLQRGPRRIPPR